MADLTIEVVREWLATNKATEPVKAFLKELGATEPKLTAETVGPWLETEDGKRLIAPLMDKRVTEAVKTHDAKIKDASEAEVKRRVAEELLRTNPQESPEQKQIRELREEMVKEKQLRERDSLRRAIVEEAARESVPSWWVDNFSGGTIEEAKVHIARVKREREEIATKAKNELLAGGFKPGSGNGQPPKSKVDVSKLTPQEALKLEIEGKLDAAIAGDN